MSNVVITRKKNKLVKVDDDDDDDDDGVALVAVDVLDGRADETTGEVDADARPWRRR